MYCGSGRGGNATGAGGIVYRGSCMGADGGTGGCCGGSTGRCAGTAE
ncbi:MAG: hypothetical protein LBI74_08145 [Synergistaceae bacterium]|nr:hypothetical protein [Synergistaceae bacterium]